MQGDPPHGTPAAREGTTRAPVQRPPRRKANTGRPTYQEEPGMGEHGQQPSRQLA